MAQFENIMQQSEIEELSDDLETTIGSLETLLSGLKDNNETEDIN